MSNSIKKDLGTGNQNIKDIQRVFELSKKLSEQKKEISDPLEDRIKNKIEEKMTTNDIIDLYKFLQSPRKRALS